MSVISYVIMVPNITCGSMPNFYMPLFKNKESQQEATGFEIVAKSGFSLYS